MMQLSPARGRLRRSMVSHSSSHRCSLAPRGDGYNVNLCLCQFDCRCSLAPRGDGYLTACEKADGHARCSLSPRGDGYIFVAIDYSSSLSMQLIPARGRLPFMGIVYDTCYIRCSLSPRGDGYPMSEQVSRTPCRCSLSPRGDGYAPSTFVRVLHSKMQLIPARGRLQLLFSMMPLVWRCSLSPRGDGYSMRSAQ